MEAWYKQSELGHHWQRFNHSRHSADYKGIFSLKYLCRWYWITSFIVCSNFKIPNEISRSFLTLNCMLKLKAFRNPLFLFVEPEMNQLFKWKKDDIGDCISDRKEPYEAHACFKFLLSTLHHVLVLFYLIVIWFLWFDFCNFMPMFFSFTGTGAVINIHKSRFDE